MSYGIYVTDYYTPWELIDTAKTSKELAEKIEKIDPSLYVSYMVIEHNKELNMDELVTIEKLEQPKVLRKSRK